MATHSPVMDRMVTTPINNEMKEKKIVQEENKLTKG